MLLSLDDLRPLQLIITYKMGLAISWTTVKKIADEISISSESIVLILVDILSMRRVFALLVLRELNFLRKNSLNHRIPWRVTFLFLKLLPLCGTVSESTMERFWK